MYEFQITNTHTKNFVTVVAKNPMEAVKTFQDVIRDESEVANFIFIGNGQILFKMEPGHRLVVKSREIWSVHLSVDDNIAKDKWVVTIPQNQQPDDESGAA
jgi:hypothetical protein